MLEVKNLDIILSNQYLIRSLSFTLNKKDKLAIIGEEGNGKSTLLKAILKKAPYAVVTGSINTKNHTLGYLEQSLSEDIFTQKVYDFLFENDLSYANFVHLFYQCLSSFGLNDTILDQEMKSLSGGEKVKVRILKLLLEDVDILLLDEPSNDLDIETLEWLEKFIQHTSKPVIYISHDETLLSNTATMILHIEQIKKKTQCRHTLVHLGYDAYVRGRIEQFSHQEQVAINEKRQKQKKEEKLRQLKQKVEYQLNTITRADPHGAKMLKKKMHALTSQEKRLDDLVLTEKPDVEDAISFFFDPVDLPKTKVIIQLDLPYLSSGEHVLSSRIKLEVIGNVHLCITGGNGKGKTTLLKYIYEQLKQRDDIRLGYMPQDYDEELKNDQYVLDFLSKKDKKSQEKARAYLGKMNFTKEEMLGTIAHLSNGTKAKLFLLKFVLDQCNVLLLDEPTRNLSPLSNPVIRKVLRNFQGAIISVSHDRKYILEVADEVYVLDEKGIWKK